MRITPLASGSQGNSLLLQAADRTVLVDIGIPLAAVEERLLEQAVAPRSIDAVFVTHRHRDHIRGVADFCEAHRTPVYGTRRTLRSLSNKLQNSLRRIEAGRPFDFGGLNVHAVQLRHDAPDTVGYRFGDGRHRFAMATDLGCTDGAITDVFVRLDALLLEFNYDEEMLEAGPYPRQLRDRVKADTGHLSNTQAAELLERIAHPGLARVWLAHLSQKNNREELAVAAAHEALGDDSRTELVVAVQEGSSPSLTLP